MSVVDSSPYPVDEDDNDNLQLGLGLSVVGGCLKMKKNEASTMLAAPQDYYYSSFMSSVNNTPNNRRKASVSSPNAAASVVGWPPIRRAHRVPILASRIKSEHGQFSSRPEANTTTNNHHLIVKVNMDGTVIGRKVDLYAHTSYETLAQTLDNMFNGRWSSIGTVGSSRLLNETSEYVLTYEDKDGDCMLVGDVPWQMFLSSVKRLRILRNIKL
ncbi:putative transcription factor interactor and regulator AUX-IAA family [Helianthus annuus]|nr:putative transcription factor interactor and regulator AUX-IAA family [Helianthus annuus]